MFALKEWRQSFSSQCPTIRYTTIRCPNILRNVIVLKYVAFHQMDKFILKTKFSYFKQSTFTTGWNGFAGRIFSPGRSLESLVRIQLQMQWAKVPQYLSQNRDIFYLNTCGAIVQQFYTFLCSPSKKSFLWRTEMIFDRCLTNVTDPVDRGWYCPSIQTVIRRTPHEIMVNSYLTRHLSLVIVHKTATK